MEQPPTGVGVPDAGAVPASPLSGPPFPVVGIGASAGGLRALQTLFTNMPSDSGMAFVVILHLSPDYESQADELIGTYTAMSVTQVVDAVKLAPDHVYVIPPAKQLRMVDGGLELADPPTEQDRRAPIDHFFRTLADTHDSRAAAIILSGTGSDGASGLKRIKEQGGTIFVQEPQDAEFDGMPRSAIATGLADFVLPVAAIPELLLAFWRRATQLSSQAEPETKANADEAVLRDILALLRVHTNHDFTKYKRATLLRRIGRRMLISGVSDRGGYLELLRSRPEEVQALLSDMLISVTNFFRDRDAWTALEAIVPLLFEGKGPGDQVRVWVTACATGEEAYSVAMLLAEHAGTLDQPPAIQVFASDIDETALSRARQGSYSESIDGDVSPERLSRFFTRDQGRYRVTQELRELVLFANHNVLRDPPFGKLDLITCRNLLIYLQRKAQEQVLQLFHFSLRPGGYLLLGNAESVDGVAQLFEVVSKVQRLFRRRTVPAMLAPLPSSGTLPALADRYAGATRGAHADTASLDELHQRLIVRNAQPSVIVTAEYEIVHLSAGAGRFLVYDAGVPSTSLLRAAHPDLRAELLAALVKAAQQRVSAARRDVRVDFGDGVQLVDLLVEPLEEGGWSDGYLFVRFSDAGAADTVVSDGTALTDEQREQFHAELSHTRQQLQLTIEAYETTGEEHKAANEELTAINEELRAASEELETSKEELQAVNEELNTVNQELKHTVDETRLANNDLQNLIAATEIATLFLDRELRLTRYTPSVERLFNLIPTDLHRPLAHVTHTLNYDQLIADAQRVLTTLQLVTREVSTTTGQWYLAQLRPYRTTDDRIAGVVVTLVDITARKQAEDALRASEVRQSFLLGLGDALRPLSDPLKIKGMAVGMLGEQTHASRCFYAEVEADGVHGVIENTFHRGVTSLNGRFRLEDYGKAWIDDIRDGRAISSTDTQHDPAITPAERAMYQAAGIGAHISVPLVKHGRLVSVLVLNQSGPRAWSAGDVELVKETAERTWAVVERARAEAALRESEDRYRTLFASIDEAFALCEIMVDEGGKAYDYRMLDVNPAFEQMTGIAPVDAIGHTARELMPGIEDWWLETYGRVALDGEAVRFEQQVAPLGRWFDAYASPVGEAGNGKFALVFKDITVRVQEEETVARALTDAQTARAEAEAALNTRDQFLSIASHELRTPLTSLMGYAYLLPRRAKEGADAIASLGERIMLQVRRLDVLVGQLLNVTRLQQGQFALDRQPLDLNALVEATVDAFRVTLPEENVQQIELRRPDKPLMLDADGPRLEQVLLNLFSNAVKYSEPGSPVQVAVSEADGQALVEVIDHGIGIPEAARARLFEPFYRASNVPPQSSGFGIGLYVAQQIVQRHGGDLQADSTEGQGTTFRIVLPLADAPA